MMTAEEKYADLEGFLLANHPWKNPQVAATAVVAGSAAYVEWIRQSVS